MAKTLTESDIAALVAKLENFPYYVTFAIGNDSYDLGPLAGAPQVSPDSETKDITLYETGAAVRARYLTRNDMNVTVRTNAVDVGLSLILLNKQGDNMLDTNKEGTLLLEPIVTGSETPSSITFPHASVNIDSTIEPAEGGDPNVVSIAFHCRADATSGKPFTYATSSASSGGTSGGTSGGSGGGGE